ncbi:MAG: discoidin domain-containing protein [Sedimentisphaerales bacterium]|nr:discoidin domain-containing protein [Sedimentisphaerales bacterium]
MRKPITCLIVLLAMSPLVLADYILTSNDGWIRRFTDDFATQVWSASAGNSPSTVLFGPDGHLYVCRLTAGVIEHYDYATGALIGVVVPAMGSTVNSVEGETVALISGGSGNVESMTFGDVGGPTGFGQAHADGVPDLIVNRRDKIEIYEGTSLTKTGADSDTWGTLLFQKYRADSAGNTEDGTGGQGMVFGPNYGLPSLYVMKGVNTATGGVYEGRFHIYDLSSPTLDDIAYPSGQGQRDSGAMILGPDVNGDGQEDLWSLDNRSLRINAYDPTTAERVATGIPIVDEQGVALPSNGLRFPTSIAHGPDGSILVTTRFRTSLDPSWTGAEQPGGNLLQLVWDQANLQAVAMLLYELPNDTGRLDGVARLITSPTAAKDPLPVDGADDVPRDTLLSWTPGAFAATHNVYFGTDPQAVEAATLSDPLGVLAAQGQTATTFDPPGRLDFGQTYYWRVDEVNAAPDETVFTGNVWSFTAELLSRPIANVTATASIPNSGSNGPDKTVDGSGLSNGEHGSDDADMWLGDGSGGGPAWIQYTFDSTYKLYDLHLWNYNVQLEVYIGFGVKDVTIDYSTDGSEWTTLGDYEIPRAPGLEGYTGTSIDLGGIVAQFVRINVNSTWGGLPTWGLSEVQFSYVPVWAREPQPTSGATDVEPQVVLTWRAGREAASHQVYFGTDEAAVADGTALLDAVTSNSYDLGTLDLGTSYYWKVIEVNEAETPSAWASAVWSFSTPAYLAVEDFETYSDKAGAEIFAAWVDGYNDNSNGSQVGYDNPPYAEKSTVHDGGQSMPLRYGQNGATFSEATRTLTTAEDWSRAGATTLVLYFHGDIGNAAAQLYVKINGKRIDYPGPTSALASLLWKQWNIDLTSLGNTAQNVNSITIGVAGSGSGLLLIDDLRLYREAPPMVGSAVDPGDANLMALYAMEDSVTDGSGHGYNGTAQVGASFGQSLPGYGKALVLDGTSGHATLPVGPLVESLSSATFATWVNWTGSGSQWCRIFDFGAGTTVNMFLTPNAGGTARFAITSSGSGGESRLNSSGILPGGWHHVAVTIDGATRQMQMYVDGGLAGEAATTVLPADLGNTTQNYLGRSQYADPYLPGSIDDFRIYNRALSEAEVRYLVGDR